MATASKKMHKFEPDYVVRPGATLLEVLEARGMSQSDLAARTGMALKTINQIINGVAPITVETADKFELVLGIPASFWNQRELAYRESLTRIEATQRLEADVAWLKEVPVRELIDRKLIEATNDKPLMVRRMLGFFGVSSVASWRKLASNPALQFRGGSAHDRKPGYVAAWRRLGILKGQAIHTEPFDAQEFKKSLAQIRSMTTLSANEWIPKVSALCANSGVAFALIKEIAGAGVSGIARWLTKDKAIIQLSLKYKTDDQIWFTFFHEAGHILLHGKKQVFTDFGYSNETADEREANAFARDLLIPVEYTNRLPQLRSVPQIKAFAAMIGVAPGIVVGRLQHDDLVYPAAFNPLKRKYEWKGV